MKKIVCTYERIIIKKIHYWLFWISVGILSFLVGEIFIRIFDEKHYVWTQILFAFGLSFLPIVIITFFYNFQKAMTDLSKILWEDEIEFEKWLNLRLKRIFTFDSWSSKIVTIFIVIIAMFTVLYLGLPFKSFTLNIIALVGFIPLVIVCAQGAYLLLDALATLKEIVHRPVKVPFFMLPHPAISRLQNYYSVAALMVTIAYICLVLAIWQGPYGFSFEMQIWLTILALYPISMYLWSFTQIHRLIQNIKFSHLNLINQEVQRTLEKVLNGSNLEDTQRLEKVMDIQTKIQNIKEWPIAIQGTFIFIITFFTVVFQFIISILEYLKKF